MHKKKHAQQVEGSDSPLLRHSRETPPRVLHPAVVSPAQERHGLDRAGPEVNDENDPP